MIEKYIFVVPLLTGAFLAAILIGVVRKTFSYYFSEYFLCTHITKRKLKKDKGAMGEYNVYKKLLSFPGKKRFLFNTYLPLGKSTTEIDVIMLHKSGVYVFESKNYQGTVYGSDYQRQWYQCTKRKHPFYNPISQNNTHINALKKVLGDDCAYHNIVVFGDEAKLRIESDMAVNLRDLLPLCRKKKRERGGKKRVNIQKLICS